MNVANTSGITGTTTVYTAADVNGSAGVYGSPLWASTGGGTTNVQTITNSGKLYVTLGSDQWVEAVFTTATSGHGIATVTCSGAVARVGNIAIPTSGPASFTNLVCSAPVSCSPSNGPTPAIACATCVTATPPPVLFATTGNAESLAHGYSLPAGQLRCRSHGLYGRWDAYDYDAGEQLRQRRVAGYDYAVRDASRRLGTHL